MELQYGLKQINITCKLLTRRIHCKPSDSKKNLSQNLKIFLILSQTIYTLFKVIDKKDVKLIFVWKKNLLETTPFKYRFKF